jgi:hypothetical protein
MKKTTIVIIVLLALLFTSILLFLYLKPQKTPSLQNSDPTADWATYESKTYSISFKYPTSKDGYFTCLGYTNDDFFFISNKEIDCTLMEQTVDDVISFRMHYEGWYSTKPLFEKETTIGGIQSVIRRYKFNWHPERNIMDVVDIAIIYLDKGPIEISVHGDENSIESRQTLFNQVLSTFKVTESNNETTSFSIMDTNQGWYWGSENQKKTNTPEDWIYEKAGRSSCWHSPDQECGFYPTP